MKPPFTLVLSSPSTFNKIDFSDLKTDHRKEEWICSLYPYKDFLNKRVKTWHRTLNLPVPWYLVKDNVKLIEKMETWKSELKFCHQLCKIARVDSIILDLVSAASIILEFAQRKTLKEKVHINLEIWDFKIFCPLIANIINHTQTCNSLSQIQKALPWVSAILVLLGDAQPLPPPLGGWWGWPGWEGHLSLSSITFALIGLRFDKVWW